MLGGVVSLFICVCYFAITSDYNVLPTRGRLLGEERTGQSHEAVDNKKTIALRPSDYMLTRPSPIIIGK